MVVQFKNVKVKNKKTGKTEIVNPYTPEEAAAKAPQTTQQATGITRPDVMKDGKWVSSFSNTEALANKKLLAEQQQREVEKIMMQNKQVSPEEAKLLEQQQAEREQLTGLLQGGEQPTVAQRNVQAGQAAVNAIIQTFGGEAVPIEQQNLPGGVAGVPGKVLLTALGKVTTQKIAGFSISDLFSKQNAGNIKELTGDADAISARGRLIYTDASTKGGNIQDSIEQLRLTEDAVRQRYADAQLALSASPGDIAEGVDFTEDIYSNLVVLQSYRQALERQQITGERNQALLAGITPTQ